MRILQVNKFYDPRGGTERVLYDLEDGLRDRGHEVGVFACAHPENRQAHGPAWFLPERDYSGAPLLARLGHAAGAVYDRRARTAFARSLDAFAPDVVHLHNIYHQLSPSILDELRARAIPAVMTVHDYKLVCPVYRLFRDGQLCEQCVGQAVPWGVVQHRCSRGSLAESAVLLVEGAWHGARRSYARAITSFLCPSEFLAGKLEEGGIPAASLEVSRNALREVPAVASTQERAGRPTVLHAGRLSPEKGVDLLIGAAAREPAVDLRIAGRGPEEGALRRQAAGLDNVTFLGQLDAGELQHERARSWMTALAARWYENAPLSVIESWWSGRPVLGAAHGGLLEMLADGEAGWAVEPGDAGAWARAFRRLAGSADPLAELGRKARARAERDHGFEDFLDRTLATYARVRGVAP